MLLMLPSKPLATFLMDPLKFRENEENLPAGRINLQDQIWRNLVKVEWLLVLLFHFYCETCGNKKHGDLKMGGR